MIKIILIKHITFVILFTIISGLNAQNHNEENYRIVKKGNCCLLLKSNDVLLDSLYLTCNNESPFKRKSVLGVINKRIIKGEIGVLSIGNFDFCFSIEEWVVLKGEFLRKNRLIVNLENYKIRKLKFLFSENGIAWKYRENLFKRVSGKITFRMIEELERINIDDTCDLQNKH